MTEVIEGEIVERGLSTVPVPARLSDMPADQMIEGASKLATILKRVVDKQQLYAVINGKKYPQVEAWMTIGRMDNVVAQEESVARQDDGSYVASVALIRLSDGSQIGRASAMCGSPDDSPWNKRAEYNRRSMAVTRATSRAFRMQYSWIMALAGYEPTPAEEMPHDERTAPPPPATRPAAPPATQPVVVRPAPTGITYDSADPNEPPIPSDAELDSLAGIMGPPPQQAPQPVADTCPKHGVPWKGEPGDYFHKTDQGYCRPDGQPRKAR